MYNMGFLGCIKGTIFKCQNNCFDSLESREDTCSRDPASARNTLPSDICTAYFLTAFSCLSRDISFLARLLTVITYLIPCLHRDFPTLYPFKIPQSLSLSNVLQKLLVYSVHCLFLLHTSRRHTDCGLHAGRDFSSFAHCRIPDAYKTVSCCSCLINTERWG